MHDPGAPPIDYLHSLDTVSCEDARSIITASIKLLGNASVYVVAETEEGAEGSKP